MKKTNKENNNSIQIAVYGTLRKGYGNHAYLNGCKYIGSGWTENKFQMTASGIPFVHKDKPVSNIRVEIYEVPESKIRYVDGLEGHPEWYKREPTSIKMDEGNKLEAELYFNTQEASTLIESGDYTDYRR